MSKGIVYWLTGLTNSGKTTIGTALFYSLKKRQENVIILDGDLLKQIMSVGLDAGYEDSDRLIRARRYAMIAKLLADQGMLVIVCTVAMFDEVREWNRENISGYIEIYVDCPDEILRFRDKKGLSMEVHRDHLPQKPDLILDNSGKVPVFELVKQIEMLSPERINDFDRDRGYWNKYYDANILDATVPSNFAMFVEKQLKPGAHIMELGCGNGRDSIYFLGKGHNIVAIDSSDNAISILNKKTGGYSNALFICDDFVSCHTLFQIPFDCIYSRFSLHAIKEEQEDEMLRNVSESLRFGGILCIEARTIHDSIYGMGEKVAKNAYILNGHFRRFIDVEEFRNKLLKLGFHISYLEEKTGFSKTNDSDPVLMRCIAQVL